MKISKALLYVPCLLAISGAVLAADAAPAPAVVAQPKFEQFDPANYKGETGKIVLPCSGTQVHVTLRKMVDGKPGDYVMLNGKSRELTAPVGKYTLNYYNVTISGKNGCTWSVNSYVQESDKASELEVKAGKSVKIGSEARFQSAIGSGKTGSLILPCEAQASVSMSYVENDKPIFAFSVSGKGKELVVPAGKYQVSNYFLSSSEQGESRWMINGGLAVGSNARIVDVKSGSKVELLPDGAAMASLKSGKTGTIALQFDGQSSLRLGFAGGPSLSISGKGGKIQVPAADYVLQSLYCSLSDKDNVPWSVSVSGAAGKALSIKPDTEVKLGFQEPLTASIDVSQNGDKPVLNLKMVSADGVQVSVMRADGKGTPPSFKILNKSGEELFTGKFAYG